MVKRIYALLYVLVVLMVVGYSIQAQGGQITIGTATYSGTGLDYNLIWDDDNNGNSVVWLDYTNSQADWTAQNTWAASLNGVGVLTYNLYPGYSINWTHVWRLPTTIDHNDSWGYNMTSSEMGHLHYTELGNTAGTSWNLKTGDFRNLKEHVYWSGTQKTPNINNAWKFDHNGGYQTEVPKYHPLFAMAVRSGEVVTNPVPDVKANGSDDPLILTQGDNLNVTLALDAGSHLGVNSDWWIFIFNFNPSTGLLTPVFNTGFQSPLFNLPSTTLLNTTGLPTGIFLFFFGVDTVPNGIFDEGQLFSDIVPVIIQ